ncbi:MAG: trp operon repressor [Thiotrichales bacterium]|nr:MAG: trp operon repressor [Thiotrichales bacterium]
MSTNKDIHHDNWQQFLQLSNKVPNEKNLKEFFDFFLTKEERNALTNRYVIVKELLLSDKPQRQIAKDSKVSIAKITRGSNSIKLISDTLRKFLLANL